MGNEVSVSEIQCGEDREVKQAPDTAVKVMQVLSFHRESGCSCNTFQMQDGVELLQLSMRHHPGSLLNKNTDSGKSMVFSG